MPSGFSPSGVPNLLFCWYFVLVFFWPSILQLTTSNSLNCPAGCPNGTWSSWSSQNDCTDSCGSFGTQTYSRTCTSAGSGCDCIGPATMAISCNTAPCPYPRQSCNTGFSPTGSAGNIVCGPVKTLPPASACEGTTAATSKPTYTFCCPAGTWSSWTTTQTCSTTACGMSGTQTWTRTCISAAMGCPCIGNSTMTLNCVSKPCPYPKQSCATGFKVMSVGGVIKCGPAPTLPVPDPQCSTTVKQVVPVNPTCKAGWTAYEGSCYMTVIGPKTAQQYFDGCIALGANVVSIHSDAENQFVAGLASIAKPGLGTNFIGLYLTRYAGNAVVAVNWADNSTLPYANPSLAPWNSKGVYPWWSGQPDNCCGQPAASCVHQGFPPFLGMTASMWDDEACVGPSAGLASIAKPGLGTNFIGLYLTFASYAGNAPVVAANWADNSTLPYANPSLAPWNSKGVYPWWNNQPDNCCDAPASCVHQCFPPFYGVTASMWEDEPCVGPAFGSAAGTHDTTVCKI
ncbi:hemicentin-1 [Ditylenchus destructor]|nr:hemicentin-1 [Ditylenchus destructor]